MNDHNSKDVDEWIHIWDRWMGEWREDEWVNICVDGCMDGPTDPWMYELICIWVVE